MSITPVFAEKRTVIGVGAPEVRSATDRRGTRRGPERALADDALRVRGAISILLPEQDAQRVDDLVGQHGESPSQRV